MCLELYSKPDNKSVCLVIFPMEARVLQYPRHGTFLGAPEYPILSSFIKINKKSYPHSAYEKQSPAEYENQFYESTH